MQKTPVKYATADDRVSKLNARAKEYSRVLDRMLDEFHKKIIGQHYALERMLIGVISSGHVLIESVPGLAKTQMIKTMAEIFGTDSVRIQFTPDLLPADITGTKIYKSADETFVTQKGPIFHSFVLADEINRAPPKVQSALLEAMQEGQVSIHGDTHILNKPFIVFATQNPIESEGTYGLPEAQIDRFAMKIIITYPTKDEEISIMERNTAGGVLPAQAISSTTEAADMQKFCDEIYTDNLIIKYVADIVRATRNPTEYGIEPAVADMIEYGASPRASIWLVKTAKAHAFLKGRGFVIPEDVKALAHDVLRHRIILAFDAKVQGVTQDMIISDILEKIDPP